MARKKKTEPKVDKKATEEIKNNQDNNNADLMGMDAKRAEIYARYEQSLEADNEYEGSEEEADDSAEIESTSEGELIIPEDEDRTDISADTEITDDSKSDKKSDDRVVPYGALHEEREKRKTIQKELEETKRRLDEVLSDFQKRYESSESDDDFSDDDIVTKKELAQLKATNAALQARLDAIEGFNAKTAQEIEKKKEMELVNSVDKALAEEGYPGFKMFGTDLVVKEINRIYREEGEEEASIYQNPQGWKILYKKLYPQVRSVFIERDKNELFDKKRKLKEKANLVSKPGIKPASDDTKKEWTYEDYLQMRQKSQL